MKYPNRIGKIFLMSSIVIVIALSGCGAESQGTEVIPSSAQAPSRSELIKEGKMKSRNNSEKTSETPSTESDVTTEPAQAADAVQLPENVGSEVDNTSEQQQMVNLYILNTNTKLFHNPSCEKVSYIAPHNYSEFNGVRDELINQGYSACYDCNP